MGLPYMKLWTQRFLGSSRVQALSGDDRWRYLGLLVHEWGRTGEGLPNEPILLARLLGIDTEDFLRSWLGRDGCPGVSQFFSLSDRGTLINDTLEGFLVEEQKFRSERSKSGSVGNKRRWMRSLSDRSAIASRDGDGCIHPDVLNSEKEVTNSNEEAEALRARIEGHYGLTDDDRLAVKFLKRFFKPSRAIEIQREQRLTPTNVNEWQTFASAHGDAELRQKIQSFRSPKEFPPPQTPKSFESDRDRLHRFAAEGKL